MQWVVDVHAVSPPCVFAGDVKAIAAGSMHSMVLKTDDTVWVTGRNHYGQLGDGSISTRNIFVRVITSGVKNVAAGFDHSMVLKTDGTVWTTGRNYNGQLGDGTTSGKYSFVKVLSGQ